MLTNAVMENNDPRTLKFGLAGDEAQISLRNIVESIHHYISHDSWDKSIEDWIYLNLFNYSQSKGLRSHPIVGHFGSSLAYLQLRAERLASLLPGIRRWLYRTREGKWLMILPKKPMTRG